MHGPVRRAQTAQAERVQTSASLQPDPAQSVQDSGQREAQVDADFASELIASGVTIQPVETVVAVLAPPAPSSVTRPRRAPPRARYPYRRFDQRAVQGRLRQSRPSQQGLQLCRLDRSIQSRLRTRRHPHCDRPESARRHRRPDAPRRRRPSRCPPRSRSRLTSLSTFEVAADVAGEVIENHPIDDQPLPVPLL
jgi:hypothetical protein